MGNGFGRVLRILLTGSWTDDIGALHLLVSLEDFPKSLAVQQENYHFLGDYVTAV